MDEAISMLLGRVAMLESQLHVLEVSARRTAEQLESKASIASLELARTDEAAARMRAIHEVTARLSS